LLPQNNDQQSGQTENSSGQEQQNIQQPNTEPENPAEPEQQTERKQLLQNESAVISLGSYFLV
jgi:hypothetical protein